LVLGNINISGPSGNANISLPVPVSGPGGKGTLYVVAKKTAGGRNFETSQVEVRIRTN
jgi:hypothetical protein